MTIRQFFCVVVMEQKYDLDLWWYSLPKKLLEDEISLPVGEGVFEWLCVVQDFWNMALGADTTASFVLS